MVDVQYSSEPLDGQLLTMEEIIPEDNVERLRNIRDMFENSNETDDQMLLHKMERVQPSEKLMKRVSNEMHDFEFNDLENLEIKTSEHQNPEQKAYSLSDESLNDNNTEEDVEETDNYCYQEKANPEKAEDSIVAKIENSLLQGNQNKEAQRSINGDNLEMCDNQSSATSSVSSSTSITSTTPDEIINDEKIIETETDSEIKDKLHAVSISNFEVNENNEVCFENENRFQDGSCEDYEDYEDNEENEIEEVIYDDQHEEVDLKAKRYARKKEKILPFADMNNVMSKFENMNCNSDDRSGPKPPRHITPPRLKALYEICNTPTERAEGVVGANDKIDDVKPQEGFIRNRRQQFTSPSSPNSNENKSHLINDIAPGSTKNAAAMFANSANESNDRWANRLKNIENSGITIEGEVVEKGLAQSRLAMFNDEPQTTFHTPTVTEQDSEILQSAAGIAKDRMNIFKNLETKGDKPREFKKLKEFTPPPTLDGQPRQYIIIDKESSPSESADRHESYNREEFIPEAGLAKNRMKQFLENSQNQDIHSHNNTEEVIGKGYAKSLLAKWKSMESMEGKEGSPTRRLSKEGSPGSVDVLNGDHLIQQGHAKSLLNKWNNIDSNSEQPRRAPRQITPPPSDDVQRNKQMFDSPQEQHLSKTVDTDAELNLIRRGNARNALAKFEQSVNESSTHVKRTVTPPRDYINKALAGAQSVYESNPTESMINAQFCEEEVIPSAGHAKSLKDKFLNLEKEKSKIETSSSKMNYVPKKFTSSAAPQSNVSNTPKQAPQVKKIEASRIANVAAGPEKPKDNSAKENNINAYLNHHTSTLHGGEKCCVCDKTVYAMEKTEADKKVYHKLCFKCTTCNCTLKLGNYSSINQTLYCTPHYVQLFARNGNYDEGFGLENYKRKWLQKPTNDQSSPTATAATAN